MLRTCDGLRRRFSASITAKIFLWRLEGTPDQDVRTRGVGTSPAYADCVADGRCDQACRAPSKPLRVEAALAKIFTPNAPVPRLIPAAGWVSGGALPTLGCDAEHVAGVHGARPGLRLCGTSATAWKGGSFREK